MKTTHRLVVRIATFSGPIGLLVTPPTAVAISEFTAAVEHAWERCSVVVHRDVGDLSGLTKLDLRNFDFDSAMAAISSAATIAAIDAGEDFLLLHAAALTDEESGSAVALVGPSGRGKTTAARILGRHFGYLTDETAAIDGEGFVRAYPKPLSILSGKSRAKQQVSAGDLGLGEPGNRRRPLGLIALLDRYEGASEPTLSRVSLARALVDMAPEISYLSRRERPLQQVATLLASIGPVVRAGYSEVETLRAPLTSELADRAALASTPAYRWDAAVGAPSTSTSPSWGMVRRADCVDALISEGELAVFTGTHVLMADGLAPEVWRASSDWITVDDLAASIRRRLGSEVETQLVAETVATMVDSSLVHVASR